VTEADWAELPGGVGSVLAVAGELRIAGQASRLRAWRGLAPLWTVEVPEQNPARPTVVGDRVLWGPYAVDAGSGAVAPLSFARPAPGYLQTAHAWSPDGSVAVVAGRRRDPGGSAPSAGCWRLVADGFTTLWTGDDVPPVAVFVDDDRIVVGHRDPAVHPLVPTSPATPLVLAAPVPPVRIDGRAGRLLVVEPGALTVWDGTTGERLGRAPGTWMDACLTPDGQRVFAAVAAGTLVRLSVGQGLSDPAAEAPEVPITAVATDGRVLLAAFAGLPGLRVRALR
jgi:hypothetical protein